MRGLIVLGLTLVAVYAVRAPGHLGGDPFDDLFVQWVYDAVASIGAALCVWRVIKVRADRTTWSLIAGAFLLEVTGNTVYVTLYGSSSGPVPSAADVFWIAFYLPMGAALLLRVRAAGSVHGAVILDTLIAVAALGSVSAALVLEAIIGGGAASLAESVTALAYPVGDLVLIALVLQLAAASGWRLGRATGLIAACFVLWAVTDTVYAFETVRGTYVDGGILDLGWVGPFALFGVAAWMPPDRSLPGRATAGGRALLVPVGFALVALVMVVYADLAGVNGAAVALAAGALVCVIARFVMTFQGYSVALGETRRVLEAAYDPFMSFDAQGRITEWNPAAEACFGWSREEVLGRDLVTTFLPADRREAHRQHIARFLATGAEDVLGRRIERTVLHRDGSELPVELTISSLETGSTYSFNAFVRDISERREVQRAKDEFVSIVSHELRTPLTSIRGSLGLLAGGALKASPDQAERMLEIALENTDRLVRLTNDILDIERIASGTVELERSACDSRHLLRAAADAMRAAATQAGVALEVGSGCVALWVDADRIQQTLTNLLSNAIKFSPAGSTVWLSAESRPGEVTFAVRDGGRGIPPEELERIFERFQQVDSSDARHKGGTGLGLPICRSIVEQHGGRIWAESVVGQGSRIQFTLPGAPPDRGLELAGLGGPTARGAAGVH